MDFGFMFMQVSRPQIAWKGEPFEHLRIQYQKGDGGVKTALKSSAAKGGAGKD